jgi:hypothetical protein
VPSDPIQTNKKEEIRRPPPAGSRVKFFAYYDVPVALYLLAGLIFHFTHGMPLPLQLAFDLRYDKFFAFGLIEFAVVYEFWLAFSLFLRKQDTEIFGSAWRARFRQEFMSLQRLVDLLHVFVALKLVLTIHAVIKQSIPLINPQLFDQELLALELLLHGNFNPMTLAVHWFGQGSAAQFIDWSYVAWFKIKLPVLLIFMLLPDRVLMQRFFFGFFALWLLGGLSAVLLPSIGPIYVMPEWFAAVQKPLASMLQAELWSAYNAFLHNPLAYDFRVYEGVAAFPSLHVGVVALFTCYFWRVHFVLGLVFSIFTGIILLGSVVLGWHYAVDGYFSIGLSYLLFRFSERLIGYESSSSINSSRGSCTSNGA